MKPKKMEVYEAGYGVSGAVKKAVAATAAAAAMLGGLTGCLSNSLAGDTQYLPPDYDGNMTVENVSDSDIGSSDACSSDDETFTLDGDVAYFPDANN